MADAIKNNERIKSINKFLANIVHTMLNIVYDRGRRNTQQPVYDGNNYNFCIEY